MSVYLKYEGESDPAELASISGWGDALRFVKGLPASECPYLHHLCTHGWEQDLADLQAEIPKVVKAHKPKADVADTLSNLLSLVKAAPKDCACVQVTNGMTADADGED